MVFSPRDEQSIRDALSASSAGGGGEVVSASIRVAPAATRNFHEQSAKMKIDPPSAAEDAQASASFVAASTAAHRRLAVSLNNAAALYHFAGEYESALRLYQECVQARMEALSGSGKSDESGGGDRRPPPSREAVEAARSRCLAVQREEQALRTAAVRRDEPACLDMYLRAGTRHDELEAAFLPRSDPVEIPLAPTSLSSSGLSSFCPPSPSAASAYSSARSSFSSDDSGFPSPAPGNDTGVNVNSDASTDDTRESSLTLYNMGLSHLRSKSVAKASQLFDMSLSVSSCSSDPVHAARTLNVSAQAHVGRGMLTEAADALSEALRLWREAASLAGSAASGRRGGTQARDLELGIADTLSLMGRVHISAGDPDRSLELARQSLRLRRSALGDDHVVVAANLYSIGLILREKGRTADAVEHVRWFVHHPLVNADPAYRAHLAEAVHTLGLLCLDASETTRAVEVFSKCVELRSAAHGAAHPALADDLLQLGRVLHDLGRFREAMDRYRSALAIETALAREDPSSSSSMQQGQGQDSLLRLGESEGVATALCSIGQIYQALGDHSRALHCYMDVLRISRALFGTEDEFVASMLSVIGNVRLEMGETEDAVADFAQAERIVRRLQEAGEQQMEDGSEGSSGAADRQGGNPGPVLVVPNLLQAMGIDFHPHAAAA